MYESLVGFVRPAGRTDGTMNNKKVIE